MYRTSFFRLLKFIASSLAKQIGYELVKVDSYETEKSTYTNSDHSNTKDPEPTAPLSYQYDGLTTIHDSSFMVEPYFREAYEWTKSLLGKNYEWYWRNYLGMRIAEYAIQNTPNFVECGVGDCWMTLSILKYFELKNIKMPYFTLFDTFSGIPVDLVDPKEEKYWGVSVEQRKAIYESTYNSSASVVSERLRQTACPMDNISIIEGAIPHTLSNDVIDKIKSQGEISYLHIDMNNSIPELAALDRFYPLVAIGGFIVLDDYGYCGYGYQKTAIDGWCKEKQIPAPLSLPTGQGLIIKCA